MAFFGFGKPKAAPKKSKKKKGGAPDKSAPTANGANELAPAAPPAEPPKRPQAVALEEKSLGKRKGPAPSASSPRASPRSGNGTPQSPRAAPQSRRLSVDEQLKSQSQHSSAEKEKQAVRAEGSFGRNSAVMSTLSEKDVLSLRGTTRKGSRGGEREVGFVAPSSPPAPAQGRREGSLVAPTSYEAVANVVMLNPSNQIVVRIATQRVGTTQHPWKKAPEVIRAEAADAATADASDKALKDEERASAKVRRQSARQVQKAEAVAEKASKLKDVEAEAAAVEEAVREKAAVELEAAAAEAALTKAAAAKVEAAAKAEAASAKAEEALAAQKNALAAGDLRMSNLGNEFGSVPDTGVWGLRDEAEWVFTAVDSDGSGTLDADEINDVIHQSKVNKFLGEIDLDGDGQVSLQEWLFYLKTQYDKGNKMAVAKLLRLYTKRCGLADRYAAWKKVQLGISSGGLASTRGPINTFAGAVLAADRQASQEVAPVSQRLNATVEGSSSSDTYYRPVNAGGGDGAVAAAACPSVKRVSLTAEVKAEAAADRINLTTEMAQRQTQAFERASGSADGRTAAVAACDTGKWPLREEAEWVFSIADSDGGGSLDVSEVTALLTDQPGGPTGFTIDITTFMAAVDLDGDGEIDLPEWLAYHKKLYDQRPESCSENLRMCVKRCGVTDDYVEWKKKQAAEVVTAKSGVKGEHTHAVETGEWELRAEAEWVFIACDTVGEGGTLDADEINQVIHDSKALKGNISEIDLDGDGKVDMMEWLHFFKNEFDQGHKGAISKLLRMYTKHCGVGDDYAQWKKARLRNMMGCTYTAR